MPGDLLHGDLTASGLVEGVCAIEHAIFGDPRTAAAGSCRSTLARSSISSMTTGAGPGSGLCVTPPPVAAAPMAFGSGVELMMVAVRRRQDG
jgi:hypothetical protein